jgi:hypothetical protein
MPISKDKPDVLFLELCGLQNSGFIQDGTENTMTPIQLRAPAVCYIPAMGYRKKKLEDGGYENEAIRWIKNCPYISVSEQKDKGFFPNPQEDIIMIEKGYATIVKNGETKALSQYLTEVYFNESNPDRVETATKLFRLIKTDEIREKYNDDEFTVAEAVNYVGQLKIKQGKSTRYNEERIDGICSLINVYADGYPDKLYAILEVAKKRPEWFLTTVGKFEQTTITEVSHALELNVIKFSGNTIEYCNKDKVILALGGGRYTHESKIERLADFLRTQEGHEAYMELKAELEAAQELALKN